MGAVYRPIFPLMFLLLLVFCYSASSESAESFSRFPGCSAGERLRGNSKAGSSRRIISVGDVHGSLIGLHEILYKAGISESRNSCEWHPDTKTNGGVTFVQTGDIVDRGPNASEAWFCLKHLQDTAPAHNSEVIRLLGNHELWWLTGQLSYRNKKSDTKEKVDVLIKLMMEEIKSGAVKGAHALDTAEGLSVFFVHAGLRPEMIDLLRQTVPALTGKTTATGSSDNTEVEEAHVLASYINAKLLDDINSCQGAARCKLGDIIYSAGPERGGNQVGGPYWTDFSVLEKAHGAEVAKPEPHFTPYVQVVGHTVGMNEIRATRGLGAVCTDAGMMYGGRAFLEIDAGRFVAYEKEEEKQHQTQHEQAKQDRTVSVVTERKWFVRDLTLEVCT